MAQDDDLPELIRRYGASGNGAANETDPDEATDAPDHVRDAAPPPSKKLKGTSSRARIATRSSGSRIHAGRPGKAGNGAAVFALTAAIAAVGAMFILRSGDTPSTADQPDESPRGVAPKVALVTPETPPPVAPRVTPEKPVAPFHDKRWDQPEDDSTPWEPPPIEGSDRRIPVIEEVPSPPDERISAPGPADPAPKIVDPAKPDAAPAAPKVGGPVVEKWPDGKVKEKYATDAKGRKTGEYALFYESGKPRTKGRYAAGEKSGTFTEYHPNGRIAKKGDFRKDRPHGRHVAIDEKGRLLADQMFLDGTLLFPRSQEQIAAGLAEAERATVAPLAPVPNPTRFVPLAFDQQVRGLKRLAAYRSVCMVPWDVELDYGYGEMAQAGTQLLEHVGHLDHTPKKPPGCPDDLYEMGYKGTSQSNLHWSSNQVSNVVEPVDWWMWDSDASNIDRVGHRRWCVNPFMKKTAFGLWKNFAAIYSFDGSRTGFEAPEWVAYPAPGWFPASFIRPQAAWHVSLGGSIQVGQDASVNVYPADDRYRRGDPLELDHFKVSSERFGMGPAVIFRPKGIAVQRGSGYWVEVKGLRDGGGKPYPLEYYVEFTNH